MRQSSLRISQSLILVSTSQYLQRTFMMVHYETGKLHIGRAVDASPRSTSITLDDRGGIPVFGMRRWAAGGGKQLQ